MTTTHTILLAFLACTLVGVIGRMDMQDAQAAQDQYCDMVAEGAWPDYRGDYERVCAGRE